MYERELRKKLYEEEQLSETLNSPFQVLIIDSHTPNEKTLMNVFNRYAKLTDLKKGIVVTENYTEHYFITAFYEVSGKGIKFKNLYDGLEKIMINTNAAILELKPEYISELYNKNFLRPRIEGCMKKGLPYTFSIKFTPNERIDIKCLKDLCRGLFPDIDLIETYEYSDLDCYIVIFEESDKYRTYGKEFMIFCSNPQLPEFSYNVAEVIFRKVEVDKNYLENWFKLFTLEINPNYIISQTHSFASNEIEKIINAMYN